LPVSTKIRKTGSILCAKNASKTVSLAETTRPVTPAMKQVASFWQKTRHAFRVDPDVSPAMKPLGNVLAAGLNFNSML
jgi:hypothetical protein